MFDEDAMRRQAVPWELGAAHDCVVHPLQVVVGKGFVTLNDAKRINLYTTESWPALCLTQSESRAL